MLSDNLVEGDDERYRLDWPGKKASLLKANTPITKTLRPCREESVNFDTTENLYIEGDNFEVLKILQESYLGKVKMIYIDPPYNTGNDFIYKDDFKKSREAYEEELGVEDEDGGKLFRNTDSNGRFHSDWLSMMYERLVVARDLLKDDGVIFISVDDNEVLNLRKISDEIFGSENFIASIIWKKSYGGGAKSKHVVTLHEYIVGYAKSLQNINVIDLPPDPETRKYYTGKDEKFEKRGPYRTQPLATNSMDERPNLRYPIIHNEEEIWPEKQWQWSKQRTDQAYKNNELLISKSNGKWSVRYKQYLIDEDGNERSAKLYSVMDGPYTQKGTDEIKAYFGNGKIFTFPKPSDLLLTIFSQLWKDSNAIVLDFFSGSCPTAEAIMKINAEDSGSRKFIMVQLPEKTDENSEAYKAGYKTIAEIGKERIRRAGKKVVSEQWEVISREKKINYGCKELSRTDCMAKSNGAGKGSLFDSQETAKGGNLQSFGSNEAGGGFDSVKHSGGAGTKLNQGVYSISSDSQGIKSGTGNTTASLRQSGIPCRYGHFGSDAALTGDRENAGCSFKNTDNCPLITNHSIDIGFRVYKTDSTNMKDVFYHPNELKQDQLSLLESNIKEDRTPEDLLTQVILDLGLELTLPIETKKIFGNTVFIVQTNALVACFDNDIDFKIVDTVADLKPFKVVFKDAGFKDDKDRINVEERFKRLSPETKVTVI